MKRQLMLATLGVAAGIGGMAVAGLLLRGGKTASRPEAPAGQTSPAAADAGATQGAPASASDPKAKEIYERLARAEEKLTSGRILIDVEQRSTRLPPAGGTPGSPEAVESARVMLKALQPEQRRERIVYDGERLFRETTQLAPDGKVRRKGTGVTDGKLPRFLNEEGKERVAVIGDMPVPDPALQLTLGRASDYFRETVWTGAEETSEGTVLTGTMGSSRVAATVGGNPLRVRKIERQEEGSTPQGPATRVFEVQLTYGGDSLVPKLVEEFLYIRGSINAAAETRLAVQKSEVNVKPASSEFALRIPAGTPVVDQRVDPPVEYVYTGTELSMAELSRKQAEQEAKRVGVGKPAPDWSLKTLDGGSVNAKDYLGKVIFLTWFASW
ncbi:MAG: TlpA family protein disulfide reductase [Armatimonadota bacterium]